MITNFEMGSNRLGIRLSGKPAIVTGSLSFQNPLQKQKGLKYLFAILNKVSFTYIHTLLTAIHSAKVLKKCGQIRTVCVTILPKRSVPHNRSECRNFLSIEPCLLGRLQPDSSLLLLENAVRIFLLLK
jgi:hypothetical protein